MDLTNPDIWTSTNPGFEPSIWLYLPAGYTIPAGVTVFTLYNVNVLAYESKPRIVYYDTPPTGIYIYARPSGVYGRLEVVVVNTTGTPYTLTTNLRFMLTID
jgi:hypothetical protein